MSTNEDMMIKKTSGTELYELSCLPGFCFLFPASCMTYANSFLPAFFQLLVMFNHYMIEILTGIVVVPKLHGPNVLPKTMMKSMHSLTSCL